MEKSDPVIDPVIEAPKSKSDSDLTEAPTPEGRDRSHSEENPTSPVKRFDGWCLDPFAEIRPHSVKTPFYDVFNDYPLPIKYDDRGKVKGIFNCFNCGSSEHRVNECEVVKDRSCIHLNKTWMQSYGKAPTAGSYRVPRTRTRYFEKLKELDELDDKDKEELKESGLKFFDSLEEMPDVPKLPSKRAKSISQMEKEEQEFRARRGGRRHYGNRGGYNNRNHHGDRRPHHYNNGGNRGGYRQHNNNNYNHHRRNQPYDNRRRNSGGNQGYNGHRNGGHNNQNNGHWRRGGYNNNRGRGGYQQRQQQVFAPEPLHPQEYKHKWGDYQY